MSFLAASHFASIYSLQAGKDDAQIINLSGRQRALSQRIVFFATQAAIKPTPDALSKLHNATSLFEQSHLELLTKAHIPARNRALYFEPSANGAALNDMVKSFIEASRQISLDKPGISARFADDIARVGPDTLLEKLDQAVTHYQAEAAENSKRLQDIETATFLAAIAVLILEGLLIFWPAQRLVSKTLNKFERQTDALKTAIKRTRAQNKELSILQERIQHDALHDPLTGLANRRYLDQELQRRMAVAMTHATSVPIMHVDLDRFKQINDTLGHAAGDYILKWVANCLLETVQELGFVARVGGDEFVIVGSADLSSDDLSALADRIIAHLSQPVPYESSLCYFGASIGIGIGIARDTADTLEPSRLLAHADIALYRAKERGRGCYQFFTPDIKTEFDQIKTLSDDILLGVRERQFTAHYQLQFDAKTLNVVSAEALVRWRHPTRGLLAPYAFLDVATSLNSIQDIDHQVLLTASETLPMFDAIGPYLPKISVNVSSQRLEDPCFMRQIESADLDPQRFTFELTETVQLDSISPVAQNNLTYLKDRGFEIEIDDFGTGQASILAVQNLRPRRIKIPRQLIMTIEEDQAQRALVSTIIDMAKAMGIDVIGEGIETFETGHILRDMGCDILQGYAYAKPAAPGALIDMIKAGATGAYSETLDYKAFAALAA